MSRVYNFLTGHFRACCMLAALAGAFVGAAAASWHPASGTFNFQWLTARVGR